MSKWIRPKCRPDLWMTLLLFWLLAAIPSSAQAVLEFNSPLPKAGGNFGISVASAGDLNGNGAGDFIVGAPVENGDGVLGGNAGRIYVFDGGTGATIWNLSAPEFSGQRYGTTVAGGADISGDGINDIIAGSLAEHAVAFNGATGDTLFLLDHPTGALSTSFGAQVGNAGDFNDDGYADVIVGAYNEDVDGFLRAGRAYVFGGPSGSLIATLESPLLGDGQFGIAVAGAGDVDNDGWDDVIVGAFLDKVNGLSDAGRAYVFSGATRDTLFSLQAPVPAQSSQFGNSVAGVGDITGDGHADVLVGALQDLGSGVYRAGRAYVFSGADGSLIHDLASPTPDLNGFFGTHVAGMGDYDGDGTDDLLVSARTEDEAGVNGSGRAHVFSGATGLWLDTFVSPNLENFGRFGTAVAGVGDVNGDGLDDVVVGAGLESSGGLNDAGRAYLFTAPAVTTAAPPMRADFALQQNYPNPFNPQTTIRFELTRPAQARLTIYSARGRRVAVLLDRFLGEGTHAVPWHARENASGSYLYELRIDGQAATKSMVLLK